MTRIDALGNKNVTFFSALKCFVNVRKGKNESDDSLLKRAKSMVEILSLAGGEHLFYSSQLSNANFTLTSTENQKKTEVNELCAVHLLITADLHRCKDLNKELANASYIGRDEHPTTPQSTYELLVQRSGRFHNLNRSTDRPRNRGDNDQWNSNTRVAFLQIDICTPVSDLAPGCDGKTANYQCYYCHDRGNTSNNCPRTPASRVHDPRAGGRGAGGGIGASMT